MTIPIAFRVHGQLFSSLLGRRRIFLHFIVATQQTTPTRRKEETALPPVTLAFRVSVSVLALPTLHLFRPLRVTDRGHVVVCKAAAQVHCIIIHRRGCEPFVAISGVAVVSVFIVVHERVKTVLPLVKNITVVDSFSVHKLFRFGCFDVLNREPNHRFVVGQSNNLVCRTCCIKFGGLRATKNNTMLGPHFTIVLAGLRFCFGSIAVGSGRAAFLGSEHSAVFVRGFQGIGGCNGFATTIAMSESRTCMHKPSESIRKHWSRPKHHAAS